MLVIGLTGGIGSGKSAAARCFGRLGARVIGADAMAARLMNSDRSLRRSLRAAFGADIVRGNGAIDRPRLASLVFSDPHALRRLNRIVHPKVIARLRRELARLRRRKGIVIVESALIVEAGLVPLFDLILVVTAPRATRISRVSRRDGISRHAVALRMRSQLPSRRLLAHADLVLRNDATPARLLRNCTTLYRFLASFHPQTHR